MLVLTRKVGERLVFGDNIVVTIADIKGENIKIAIDAPKDIKIYRGEIYDAIVEENKKAVAPLDVNDLEMLKSMIVVKDKC